MNIAACKELPYCCFAQDQKVTISRLEKKMERLEKGYDILLSKCPDSTRMLLQHQYCNMEKKAIIDAV